MRSLSVAYFLMTVFAFPANAADNTYDIQPGDTLELHVVGVPELTYRTTVSPQGLVSFPLVEDVVAAGRSLQDVRAELRTRLSQVALPRQTRAGFDDAIAFQDSQVTLTIAEYRPIYVNGNVANPGAHAFRIGMTVREALAVAGGVGVLRNTDALPVQTDYAIVMGELAREHMRLMALRAEKAGRVDISVMERSAVDGSDENPDLLEIETERVANRVQALAAEKTFLTQAIAAAEYRLESLRSRRENEAALLEGDEADFKRINGLFQKSLTGADRLSDARRNVLVSSTRLLQTDAAIAGTHNEIMDLRRRIVRQDEAHRETLLGEIRESERRVQDLQTRMLFLGQKLALTGTPSDAREKLTTVKVTIFRRNAGNTIAMKADPDSGLAPGDVIEVELFAFDGAARDHAPPSGAEQPAGLQSGSADGDHAVSAR